MRTHSKVILAALTATMLLAIAANGATARTLRVNERNFEWVWNDALGAPKTKTEIIAATSGVNVQCKATYLGSFVETQIIKETRVRKRQINHVEVESCTGGQAIPGGLPWPVFYRGFFGTLPRIRGILWEIFERWRIREPNGVECEFASEANHPAVITEGNSSEATETGLESTGEPEDATFERATRIPLRGEFLCALAGEAEFGGIALVRNLPRTGKIRITLI